jgi:predicted nucleic acid-binding protein
MASLVLDCSVALAWFLPGERTPRTEDLLDQVVDTGALVPSLWPVEVANVLLAAERKRRISQAQRVRALTALAQLPIEMDAETASRSWGGAFDLAVAQGLTLYDALYLELSLRSGLPLATLDHDLCRAAKASGVPVLGGEKA